MTAGCFFWGVGMKTVAQHYAELSKITQLSKGHFWSIDTVLCGNCAQPQLYIPAQLRLPLHDTS